MDFGDIAMYFGGNNPLDDPLPMEYTPELTEFQKRKKDLIDREDKKEQIEDFERKQLAHNLARGHLRNRKSRGRSPTYKPVTSNKYFALKTPPRLKEKRSASTPPWKARQVSRSRSRSRSSSDRKPSPIISRGNQKMPAKKIAARKRSKTRSTSRQRSNVGAGNLAIPTGVARNANTVGHTVRGILYPHANTKPRHLDGATVESQTRFSRNISEMNIAPNETGIIIMTPNSTLLLSYRQQNGGGISHIYPDLTELGIDTTQCTATGNMKKQGDVDRWRLVSKGLKLSLLNTTDTNDGWFESFRVTSDPNVDEMQIINSATAGLGYLGIETPFFDRINQAATQSQLRGSYHADAVKNIGGYYFKLNPYAEEHPFIDVNGIFSIRSTDIYQGIIVPFRWSPGPDDTQSYRPILDAFLDATYDTTVVIIHGGASGTNILMDVCCNEEVVYENSSALARFHTAAHVNRLAQRQAHNVQQAQPQAAMSIATK